MGPLPHPASGRVTALLAVVLLLNLAILPQMVSSFYQEQTATVGLVLPMYTVESEGGYDYVEIPGGSTQMVVGEPMVPIYTEEVLLPAGQRVQSVSITGRGGFTNASGLILPMFEANIIGGGVVPNPGGSSGGWYPELELTWEASVLENGSGALSLTLYPFRYNANTTESSYCSQYALELTYVTADARITGISSDETVYDPGETVVLEIVMENPDEAEDFVVGVKILKPVSLEPVGALPLRTVHALQGVAAIQINWTETGVELGEYIAMAEMNDTAGHWLSTALLSVPIGMPKVEITAFSAYPQHFGIGEVVEVGVTARNVGAVESSGTCIVQIRDDEGLVQNTQLNFTGLKPHQQRMFTASWDTSNATEDEIYTALVYIYYDGTTTPAESCILSTNQLPVAVISYAPTTAWTGLNITFNASSSYDPDGSVVACLWDFGALAGSNGTVATHAYLQPGNYSVSLTAVDDKGASSLAYAIIEVGRGYYLNVTSNAGVAVQGSGLYPEGATVQVSAPTEAPAAGIMGTLGSKLVFVRWSGASNSTANTMSLTVDYEASHHGLVAVYQEQTNLLMIVLLVVAVVAVLTIAFYFLRMRKRPPPPG